MTIIVLLTFTAVDFWPFSVPHAWRCTIAMLGWPADVSQERH